MIKPVGGTNLTYLGEIEVYRANGYPFKFWGLHFQYEKQFECLNFLFHGVSKEGNPGFDLHNFVVFFLGFGCPF